MNSWAVVRTCSFSIAYKLTPTRPREVITSRPQSNWSIAAGWLYESPNERYDVMFPFPCYQHGLNGTMLLSWGSEQSLTLRNNAMLLPPLTQESLTLRNNAMLLLPTATTIHSERETWLIYLINRACYLFIWLRAGKKKKWWTEPRDRVHGINPYGVDENAVLWGFTSILYTFICLDRSFFNVCWGPEERSHSLFI